MNISQDELDLSAKLNVLLGELGAEMSQLPTERTISQWTTNEVLRSVCRCKDALIDALRCAVRLSQLGEIDGLSEQWIREVLDCVDVDQSLLDYVEGDLVRECQTSRW